MIECALFKASLKYSIFTGMQYIYLFNNELILDIWRVPLISGFKEKTRGVGPSI